MLFAGVDGGQSSTVAVIGDATHVLARGTGPPADLVGEAHGSQRQRLAIEAALDDALAGAGIAPHARFDALVAGVSGFDTGISIAPDLSARAGAMRVVHDTSIAHAGALGGAPGIVVIAGTGSVALGNEAASTAYTRAGGWGYFFGDEGSALWIARTALRRAMARDDAGTPSELGARARTFFGATSLRTIQHAFASGDLTRPALAAFARDVIALAAAGEADAVATCDAAAAALAHLCTTIDARLTPARTRRISYDGGVFADAAFVRGFAAAVTAALPHATVTAPAGDAAAGALALARALARDAR